MSYQEPKFMKKLHDQRTQLWNKAGKNSDRVFELIKQGAHNLTKRYGLKTVKGPGNIKIVK